MYFSKLLIANRGEIAVRIIRACHALGIAAVAVYSEADRAALHVRLADEAYLIGPAAATASYLSAPRIIEAAQRCGAQAIHPGYGFLSERAHFARACREAGLVFVGPPAEAIERLGAKIGAKLLATSVGVPTAPSYLGADQSLERLQREAQQIGFPLLIKASAGGGGRGMRVVTAPAELPEALAGAQREALAAFGDPTVFLEQLILHPRHIEIQVLADSHGHCVHLFERECSIQRRHQKILEESPASTLAPELRDAMGAAAVRLALAAGYVGAGTVEFLLETPGAGQPARPAFLEMNTRLQVEHPVTELVTGLDLVQLQIAIAAGAPLPFTQADLAQRGHAIEVRVCAEDPQTFLPSTGRVALFAPPEGDGVRNDVGLASGDEVSVNYDPLLAKLIVSGPDRPTAIARLRQALERYAVLGITTNLPLLRAVAAHPAFAAGETFTDFLTTHDMGIQPPAAPPPEILLAAALAAPPAMPRSDPWQSGAWRLLDDGVPHRFRYAGQELLLLLTRRASGWRAQVGAAMLDAEELDRQPHALSLSVSRADAPAVTLQLATAADGADMLVGWEGWSYRLEPSDGLRLAGLHGAAGAERDHAGLTAPMPGTVIRVLVAEGQAVTARQPLVVLEAMKMEHIVAAPYDGVVTRLHAPAGALVNKGAPLIEIEAR